MSAEILIDLSSQVLELVEDGDVESYPVSTALAGAGEEEGSFKTPRGRHVVRAKIGAGMPDNTVFKGRRPTGEIYSLKLAKEKPRSDWILTRILWLSGCEPGKNRFGNVDTMRRYIYIHGTPDDTDLSKPGSIGCVRMRNHDIVRLFDKVRVGISVNIVEGKS